MDDPVVTCPACGAPLAGAGRYCAECGRPLRTRPGAVLAGAGEEAEGGASGPRREGPLIVSTLPHEGPPELAAPAPVVSWEDSRPAPRGDERTHLAAGQPAPPPPGLATRLVRGLGFAALGLLLVFKVAGGFLLSAGVLKLVFLAALLQWLGAAPLLVALVVLLVAGGIVGSVLLG